MASLKFKSPRRRKSSVGTSVAQDEITPKYHAKLNKISRGVDMKKVTAFKSVSQKGLKQQFLEYSLVVFITIFLNSIFLYYLVEHFQIWYILAQIIVISFLSVFNFFIYKKYVFR